MKNIVLTALAAVVLASAAGCAVVPPRPVALAAAPGVVYLEPTYARPAVGYVWAYHPHYGWGWRHPVYGWHAGWR